MSTAGVTERNPKITITKDLIDNLATGLATFIGYKNPGGSNDIGDTGIAVKGQPQDTGANSVPGYKLTYHRTQATWDISFTSDSNRPTAAKIFLGCVPMIFSALSYLYWRCHENGGGWSDQYFRGSYGINTDLKDFVVSTGFRFSEIGGNKGSTVMATVAKTLKEFSDTSNKTSYPAFIKTVRDKPSALQPPTLQHYPLSSLHLLASTYFTHKQSKADSPPTGSPKSIREMLYFLAALPFSPSYDGLVTHIDSVLPSPIRVAVSGSPSKDDTLSVSDLNQHLITSCAFSPIVLGRLQGHSASISDEPWLHSLYCNSMNLQYPAGPALFNALSNYSYVLQFQLSFLHQQCMSGSVNCGWLQCKYGSGINTNSNTTVPSHICSTPCQESGKADCQHNSTKCKHGDRCGNNTSNSPLQAFLTDNLVGFHVSEVPNPTSLNHLKNHPPASMCHVKMGFHPTSLRPTTGTGRFIYYTLEPFCGSPISPLRQLCEKLSCLTKRTPRTLGDVFGFYLQLVGQLFNTRMTSFDLAGSILVHLDSSIRGHTLPRDAASALTAIDNNLAGGTAPPLNPSGHTLSLMSLYKEFPFWFQLFMVDDSKALPLTLFDLRQHCHNLKKEPKDGKIYHYGPGGEKQCDHSASNSPGDLWSVCYPIYDAKKYPNCKDGNCGGYFFPLTQSTGATYAPKFALTYFSWVLYLADDLQTGLQELLSEFTQIDCKHSGCKTKSNSTCQCTPGQHGNPSQCTCPSVVQCGGVLPLIYRHGFQFHDAQSLNGGKGGRDQTKRDCQKFSQQLSNVLAENAPLHNLLLAIDEFLYYVRFRFISTVSSFWLCSLVILLYFIFYGVDVLHLQSHVHLPSSHTVPPIGLLTTGKAPALTKLTYYMP
ncbi:extracellular matrix-binding ebh [Babesia caballi]|uniref:Extracellular matrix-binding ebh n=1 Tax=Babesia caballi TaxID=5871 RepID=A0AAV4LPY9_BABCB|nr:extracellular matrix-binding ebh [Babesia caballi]